MECDWGYCGLIAFVCRGNGISCLVGVLHPDRPWGLVELAHMQPVSCVRFDPSGRQLLTACDDGTVSLWQMGDAIDRWGLVLSAPYGPAAVVALQWFGRWRVDHVNSQNSETFPDTMLRRPPNHSAGHGHGAVRGPAGVRTGFTVVTADGTVHFAETSGTTSIVERRGHLPGSAAIVSAAIGADGVVAYTDGGSRAIRTATVRWRSRSLEIVAGVSIPTVAPGVAVAFDAAGQDLYASGDQRLRVYHRDLRALQRFEVFAEGAPEKALPPTELAWKPGVELQVPGQAVRLCCPAADRALVWTDEGEAFLVSTETGCKTMIAEGELVARARRTDARRPSKLRKVFDAAATTSAISPHTSVAAIVVADGSLELRVLPDAKPDLAAVLSDGADTWDVIAAARQQMAAAKNKDECLLGLLAEISESWDPQAGLFRCSLLRTRAPDTRSAEMFVRAVTGLHRIEMLLQRKKNMPTAVSGPKVISALQWTRAVALWFASLPELRYIPSDGPFSRQHADRLVAAIGKAAADIDTTTGSGRGVLATAAVEASLYPTGGGHIQLTPLGSLPPEHTFFQCPPAADAYLEVNFFENMKNGRVCVRGDCCITDKDALWGLACPCGSLWVSQDHI